jgi:hypothetical protein
MTKPHVFVTMGDVTKLVCDAWLLPGDTRPHVSNKWTHISGIREYIDKNVTDAFTRGTQLTLPLVGMARGARAVPILAPVDGKLRGKAHLEAVVNDFVRVGAGIAEERAVADSALKDGRPWRDKPLLAMPLFGSGNGGFASRKGELISMFLEILPAAAERHNVDIALVLFNDSKSYAMAQSIRRKYNVWDALDARLIGQARTLAQKAMKGELVPFMGAGVSAAAGMPGWLSMLSELANRAKLTPEQKSALFESNLDLLDQASFIESSFQGEDGPRHFRHAIADLVRSRSYALPSALLASLRCEQAITMNYDALYESAYESTGQSLSVIPDSHVTDSPNWLLKLHGSATAPYTIVLTRDDYLGYNTSREALSAIVKANLITRHILFVGFGLVDPHFHQIMHDVKRALPGMASFATAITEIDETHLAELWKNNLDVTPMVSEKPKDDNRAPARRLIEVFLDVIGAYATDGHEYFLDDDYESGLSPEDCELRAELIGFAKSVSPESRESSSWARVEKLMKDLGSA